MSDLPLQPTPPVVVLDERAWHHLGAQVLALPVMTEGDSLFLGPGAAELADDVDLLEFLEFESATGKAGEIHQLALPAGTATVPSLRQVLLVGVGSGSKDEFRKAGAALARAVKKRELLITTIASVDPAVALEPFVTGLTLASFSFEWRGGDAHNVPVKAVTLAGLDDSWAATLARANSIAAASWQARFLATVPSNLKSPEWLADQAVAAAERSGLAVTVWDHDALVRDGFGGILGVGQGSANPPRFVRLDYTPAEVTDQTRTVVLVGKGITFDSGGYNLKPGESMTTMKRDMTGAGVVMGVMEALPALDVPVKVTGLLCIAENLISGGAMRPSDILRHYPGDDSARTSEVNNTDAEGRLVLADGLSYAVRELKPDVLVDVATLTGAAKVALGQQLGALFATNNELAAAISAAGAAVGEPWWRLPLSELYEEKLSAPIGDGDNSAGGPGAITAALFLQHFTAGLPWVHLDIASVGDAPADRDEWTHGPTGFGARTLLKWLATSAETLS